MPLGLIALAIGAFGIGLAEFSIMGLLPALAADFGTSEATAGWLISGYALSVVVSALGLTAATTRSPRKKVLLGLVTLFIIGHIVTALSATYLVAMIGRVLAALCHGAFFSIGSVMAADLVAPEKKSQAIALMFTGMTAANVFGVPFGTFIGQQFGWRATFWVIALVGVAALISTAVLVPALPSDQTAPSLRNELEAFRSGQVWASLSITILAYGGMFGAFTYIAYTFTEVSGFAASTVPWLLVLFGIGLVIGNWVGGRLADRSIDATLISFVTALILVMAGFGLLATSRTATIVAVILMGGLGFGTVPGLQSRIMAYAGGAPTLASGANIGAFNIGNALGAWAGGLGISAGLGYTSPLWIGAVISTLGLGILLIAARSARQANLTRLNDPSTDREMVAAH